MLKRASFPPTVLQVLIADLSKTLFFFKDLFFGKGESVSGRGAEGGRENLEQIPH